jgi:asparagine synthase (glutamine-hydrolysing)
MGGIAGIVDPAGAPIDRQVLSAMTRALRPRGPDAEGWWSEGPVGLGHTRLAIIDLAGGAQPMSAPEADVHLVFDGEIYNFMDVRAELQGAGHGFRTRSDTEVLLRGYLQWGPDVLARLEGAFAFALWDGRAQRLFAARDRMGGKPFYFARIPRDHAQGTLFAFASELKALLAVPQLSRRIHMPALAQYLTLGHVPPPLSILADVRKLDAGERLTFAVGPAPHASHRIDRYWDLPFPELHTAISVPEATEHLHALLKRAVERRLMADVPLGVFVSDEIASPAVVATTTELLGSGRNLRTFALYFSGQPCARGVAGQPGCERREEILDERQVLDTLPDIASAIDEPLADAQVIPKYLLARFTRGHVTIALGGEGAELFAGHPKWGARLFGWRSMARQFLRGGDMPGPRRHQRWRSAFLPEEQESLLRPEIRAEAGVDPLCILDERVAVTTARGRHDLLLDFETHFRLRGDVNTQRDRTSGAVGLATRSPFLDTQVVTFACGLPPSVRNRDLLARVMPATMRAVKTPALPVARWLKADLAPALRDELAPDKLRREGLFQSALVGRLLDEHENGRRDHGHALWTLFTFERWFGAWGRG